jgi:hypothetical protein
VVATGTHETLTREDGLYRRLAALQFDQDAASRAPVPTAIDG